LAIENQKNFYIYPVASREKQERQVPKLREMLQIAESVPFFKIQKK